MAKTAKRPKVKQMFLGRKAFVDFICDPDNSKTYNRAKYAYMAAYPNANPSSAKSSGCRLLTFDSIKRAIEVKRREIAEINSVDSNFVKGEHLRLLDLSEAKGDLPTATRNVEGLARTVGAYKEVHEDYLFPGRRPENYDPVAASEAKRKAFIESQVVEKGSSLPADGQTTGTKL